MNLITSSVDLEGITSPVPRSQFDENELEYLANLFLKSGDTVSPILLQEKSPISFEVLEGHREYYAALKAQEIDSRFESIRAYVVPSDRQDSILEQYRFFHDSDNVNGKSIDSNSAEQKISIADIQRIIEDKINPLKSSLRDISTKIDQFEKIVENLLEKYLKTIKPVYPSEQEFINELNESDLARIVDKFSQAGYTNKTAESYAKEILNSRKIKTYESIKDIKSRKNAKGKAILSSTALDKLYKIWWVS